ncbi:hypothetical protein BT63DRAFT_308638 [Microthyrium microscopicum]|uniref:Myosin class II heavy chain n=1 Tax=Microthyrium microscopicum TaxID=703497 RepID=A0A6A6U8X2_9PEZI|nr:hypothetical protein BT63DRAFT_308638 [Microthyrium microscopicum]
MPASSLTGAPSSPPTLASATINQPDDQLHSPSSPHNDNSYGNLSETDTLGPDSPEIAPLPAPPRLPFTPRTPLGHQSASDATFYTASWGSPYPESVVPAGRHSNQRANRRASSTLSLDENEEESPQIAFGLSHLIPSRFERTYEVTPTRPTTPTGWSPSQVTPRGSAPSIEERIAAQFPARNLLSSFSKVQRTPDHKTGQDLEASSQRLGKLVGKELGQNRKVSGHRSHSRNRTLRQEDITPPQLFSQNSAMESSKYASSPMSKPTPSGTPARDHIEPPSHSQAQFDFNLPSPSPNVERTLSAGGLQQLRTRKRLTHKGKACWVALPVDPPRGGDGQAPYPLSAQEIAERLKRFQDQGYDVRGFGHWSQSAEQEQSPAAVYAQNRDVYPDVGDYRTEAQEFSGKARIQIPNPRLWQDHVRELKEAKLRALGVSLGDDPPEPSLSRRASSQFSGLPFSPPLPTSSAGSQRMGPGGNVFPMGFVPGSSNHTSTRSIASPISSMGNPRQSMHMHRQSMFTSPPMIPQQAISPQGFNAWSPQPFGMQNAPLSSNSPLVSSGAVDMRSPISPFNPMADSTSPFQFPQRNELVAQLQHQKQQQLVRQQQLLPIRPASTLAEVLEVEAEEDPVPATRSVPPEMFNPRPGHRHNISAKLEESIHKSSFSLDKKAEPSLQKVEDVKSPIEGSSEVEERESTPKAVPEWRRNAPAVIEDVMTKEKESPKMMEKLQEQPATLEEEEEAAVVEKVQPQEPPAIVGRTYGLNYNDLDLASSDIDTNPSEHGMSSPPTMASNKGIFTASNPWDNDPTFMRKAQTSEPKHAKQHSSKASISGLNVTAREFNPGANPAAVFNPSIFNASAFAFHPEKVKDFVPRSIVSAKSSVLSHSIGSGSIGTPTKTLFNLNAPEFSPTAGGFGGGVDLSKSEFSFASKAPILKPTAPVFNPAVPAFEPDKSFGSVNTSSSDAPGRLFSGVDFTEFSKPVKKSKAVPIVPPSAKTDTEEEIFDKDGRLAAGNAKRMRKVDADGDDVPLFAIPNPDPLPASLVNPVLDSEPTAPLHVDSEIEIVPSKAFVQPTPTFAGDESPLFPSSPLPVEPEGGFPARTSSLPRSNGVESAQHSPIHLDASPAVPISPVRAPDTPVVQQNVDDSIQLTPKFLSDEDDRAQNISEQLISPPSSAVASRSGLDADFQIPSLEGTFSSPPNKLPSSVRYYDDMEQPDFNEIDAVMQHINQSNSEADVERDAHSWPETSPTDMPTMQLLQPHLPANLRSDAPSPSPRRGLLSANHLDLDSASVTQDPFSDGRGAIGYESPVRQLNEGPTVPISDWDDFSSGEEEQIRARGPFLDAHVSSVINSSLSKRLGPLERQLKAIESAMSTISSSRPGRNLRSRATMDSDADDEDDEIEPEYSSRAWSRSPVRDRKNEKMRLIIQEALATYRPVVEPTSDTVATASILAAVQEMRSAFQVPTAQILSAEDVQRAVEGVLMGRKLEYDISNLPQLEDIKAAVESAVASQTLTTESSRTLMQDENPILSELLQRNSEAHAKIAEEAEARKYAERKEAESQRLLKLAEEELELLRASASDDGDHMRVFEDKSRDADQRVAMAESASADLQVKVTSLSETNVALKATLDEYRISHDKWRADMDNASREKERLAAASGTLKIQAEEAIRIRETMRDRLDKLQADTASATGKLADERAKWQRMDAEHRTRYEIIKSQAQAEARTRERFEQEMNRLEVSERENMKENTKLRALLEHVQHEKNRLQGDVEDLLSKEREAQKAAITLEHLQKENSKLEQQVDQWRSESSEHEKTAEKYAREWQEARDSARTEVQRTRLLMQADIDAANNHANIVRAGLEDELNRLRVDLESAKMEADAARAKEELIIEQEADSKRDAIREVIEGKTSALHDQRQVFEERLEELRRQHRRDLDHVIENKNQSETFLREAHASRQADMEQQSQRSLEQAYEDKERSEAYFADQLNLASNKIELLEDKVHHLNQKLEVTKTAAQAAAQAAQSTRSPAAVLPSMPSMFGNLGGASAKALRESIDVLQDQLQEREARIEALEQQVGEVDPEALKGRDVEIGWLRELLGVRVDDLSDLINLLGREDFDRESVQNAAIRIRTSLQMEMHEKERHQGTGNAQPLSAMSSNLAANLQSYASPRVAQLGRVLNDWRGTPAKRSPNSTSSFLSGLMTPPASHMRRTPEPPNTVELRRDSAASASSQAVVGRSMSSRQAEKAKSSSAGPSSLGEALRGVPPRTPPLLQRGGYDEDAETGRFSADDFYDDEDSTVDGTPRRLPPFGRSIES